MPELNVDSIREEAKTSSEKLEKQLQKRRGEECHGHFDDFEYWHHDSRNVRCSTVTIFGEEDSETCDARDYEEAEYRLRALRHLDYFMTCFKDPTKASSRRALAGMVQESCIYDYT